MIYLWTFLVFVLGLALGTFLNVVIHRVPRGLSVFGSPPACPGCGTSLSFRELVPLVSFIVRAGRCRRCGRPISWRYPLLELASGSLLLLTFLQRGPGPLFWHDGFLVLLLLAVAIIDLEHHIIPNRLLVVGLIGWVPLALLAHPVPWTLSILGLAVAGGFFFLVAVLSRGGMGAGDVKLAGVMGLYLGLYRVIISIFVGVVVGGLVGLLLLLLGLKRRRDYIPFGPFLVLGGIIALFWDEAIIAWYLSLY